DRLSGVRETSLGVVEPDAARAEPGQRTRPLRASAAELEHILAGHVVEDAELRFGHLPDAPRAPALDEVTVPRLVGVALAVPELPVPACVLAEVRQARLGRTRARP